MSGRHSVELTEFLKAPEGVLRRVREGEEVVLSQQGLEDVLLTPVEAESEHLTEVQIQGIRESLDEVRRGESIPLAEFITQIKTPRAV